MAKEYIERDAVLEICEDAREEGFGDIRGVMHRVRMLNAADVVEVVRCRDCVKRKTQDRSMYYESDDEQYSWEVDDDFCSQGERRDSE